MEIISSVIASLNPTDVGTSVIKIDPITGFCEFPPPGDARYYTLPNLKDFDADKQVVAAEPDKQQDKEYWMPDVFCKVCFACDDSFTMYRRRHHCRICGQVFCNPCSSFYVNGDLINLSGSVRACELCFKHLEERGDLGGKAGKHRSHTTDSESQGGADGSYKKEFVDQKKISKISSHEDYLAHIITSAFLAGKIEKSPINGTPLRRTVLIGESVKEMRDSLDELQSRASLHMKNIVQYLLRLNTNISNTDEWENVIVSLINSVVTSVDPNVRNGDKLDIRPFVKLKSIPGGSVSESAYVEGVVFRKNVAHKKMVYNKEKPKILILSGGIEFHRQDFRLSSLDTLIDQEDKFLEIMVEKIMSLSPDIILVGKSVSRRAQELLCSHHVVVFQHVKERLLERIARMTHAMMLPSIDHMIQQFGKECLGSCGSFSLSQLETAAGGAVADDHLTRIGNGQTRPRITSTVTGTTYVYLDGCAPNLGCTLVLRGARKPELKHVKQIIRFCVMVAYHLRLEVAYLADRCAHLPLEPDGRQYEDDSDCEQTFSEYASTLSQTAAEDSDGASIASALEQEGKLRRCLLSLSLDVDVGLPYMSELRMTGIPASKRANVIDLYFRHLSPLEHQTLNISSILMSDGHNQRGRPEIKGIEFYTEKDVPVGQFVIESCFNMVGMGRAVGSKINMLEHTLSFVHRPGRIDIATFKAEGLFGPGMEAYYHSHVATAQTAQHNSATKPETEWELQDYLRFVQLKMASYCKTCAALVTPDVNLSEETWKMSFGKFLEINFYNRSARCRTGGCSHSIRDHHVLFLFCDEGYVARFEFHPIHPLTITLRQKMPMPAEFHNNLNIGMLDRLGQLKDSLVEDFRMGLKLVEKLTNEYFSSYPQALEMALSDIQVVRKMVTTFHSTSSDEIVKLMNEIMNFNNAAGNPDKISCGEAGAKSLTQRAESSPVASAVHKLSLKSRFPSILKREMFFRSILWRHHLKRIHDYIEAIRNRYSHQSNAAIAPPSSTPSSSKSVADGVSPLLVTPQPPSEEVDIQAIRDFYMNESSKVPFSVAVDVHEEGLFGEAIEEFEDVAKKFVINPALLTMRASVNTVVNIGQSAATMLSSSEAGPSADTDQSADSKAGNASDPVTGSGIAVIVDSERDKVVSRIGKLKTKLLRKDTSSTTAGNTAHDLSEGRPAMASGRNGIVVEVHEEELATVIAFSLASVEYADKVNEYLLQANLHTGEQTTGDAELVETDNKQESIATTQNGGPKDHEVIPFSDALVSSPGVSIRKASTGSIDLRTGSADNHDDIYDDDDRHEGEVTDIHLADDPTYAIAEERLEAAFKEGGDACAESEVPRVARSVSASNSEVFGLGKDNAEEGDGLNETARFENIEHENKEDSRNYRSRIIEKQLSSQRKSHIKHRFVDTDERDSVSCKFICHTFWACQFEALRAAFLEDDSDEGYIRSLGASAKWQAQGGKSGASFSKTLDGRFVVKYITRTELQMFLDFAPAYFEYMQKVFYLGLPTILCKVLGVYQIGYHNRMTGKKVMEQVVVMENLFFEEAREIVMLAQPTLPGLLKRFDYLKCENRYFASNVCKLEQLLEQRRKSRKEGATKQSRPPATQVLMDHNLMELTDGKPLPLKFKANVRFHKAMLNDTLFLSIINVVDYSILVGIDEDTQEMVVGIIDYMRQYDIIKRMERMGKSVGMIAGQAEPTVIQPVQYRKRFVAAMDKYFMGVPDKWSLMK